MKALVTGGAGFIGSHLVEELVKEGIEVKVFDNLTSGNLENLKHIQPNVEIIEADIRDIDVLRSAMQDIDWVFHLAALASVVQSVNDPFLNQEINSLGTLNVLWSALKAGVSKVVIASSCAVYGDAHTPPLNETLLPMPKSPYAATKLTAEAYAESFYETYGLEVICLRFFNVYGPRQKANSDYAAAIPIFVDCYKQKKPPVVYGDGLQSRDFIHVKDIARANILAAKSTDAVKSSRVFNIGTGTSVSILKLLETISRQAGYYLEPEFKESRKGDIKDSCANTTLAREKLGFIHSVSLEEGIKDLYLK